MKQKGQMILMLILIMTVALAIGLSIVQKSLVDVSTSSKVEQSSRAFSAAEAGIEKALNSQGVGSQTFDNNSKFLPIEDSNLPPAPKSGSIQDPLEYPPLAKEDVAQVWLADPDATLPTCKLPPPLNLPAVCYTQQTLDVYWGNSATDKAALELTLVHFDTEFKSRKWFLDNISANRKNGFDKVPCSGNYEVTSQVGTQVISHIYQCKERLGDGVLLGGGSTSEDGSLPPKLMLLRARLLYNSTSQPFAVQATKSCASGCLLPSQARKIISTGASGETQRKIQVFQFKKVVPHYFDYAIFSAGEITK